MNLSILEGTFRCPQCGDVQRDSVDSPLDEFEPPDGCYECTKNAKPEEISYDCVNGYEFPYVARTFVPDDTVKRHNESARFVWNLLAEHEFKYKYMESSSPYRPAEVTILTRNRDRDPLYVYRRPGVKLTLRMGQRFTIEFDPPEKGSGRPEPISGNGWDNLAVHLTRMKAGWA